MARHAFVEEINLLDYDAERLRKRGLMVGVYSYRQFVICMVVSE